MKSKRSWQTYAVTYRAREMKMLTAWIQVGQSGAVVGMGGAGKSNLLGFLSHRPDVLQHYLSDEAGSVVIVPVDLNNLPARNLSTVHRVILRAFYEIRSRFDDALKQTIERLYLENRATRDPFLSQSALRELLFEFQGRQTQVILILDRFDRFSETELPQITDTLRGLRDSFKDTLCFIVGSRQEVAYLSDPMILGEIYEILDTLVCWVGPMSEEDARQVIAEETHSAAIPPTENEIKQILALTGGYPSLLKAVCHWWLSTARRPDISEWLNILLAERSLQFRLDEIWAGLTQEEQYALSEWYALSLSIAPTDSNDDSYHNTAIPNNEFEMLQKQHQNAISRLITKGLCTPVGDGWRIFSDLFSAYIAGQAGQGGGKIWLDETTGLFFRGQTRLEGLTPLEQTLLNFLVENPHARHTKSALIDIIWPDEFAQDDSSREASLFQVIKSLRQKVEPKPAKPRYIITWRGKPEGGYQFFPEGRPD